MNIAADNYFAKTKKNITTFVLAFCFVVSSFAIYAQEFSEQDYDIEGKEVLYIGETRIFPAKKTKRIVVGNPEIADVGKTSDESIFVVGKSVGATIFIYWDVYGEHSYRLKILSENMTETKRRVDKLLSELKLSKVYTKSNDEEGKVLLLGEVQNKEEKDRIELALGNLKSKTLDLIQIKDEGIVEIEVRVLELDKDASKTLGFTMPASISVTESSGPTTTAVTGFSSVFHVSDWTRSALLGTLDFLIQEGNARILSQPKLACLSGKEAELLVGGEKPTFTTAVQATAGSSTTVEYKEYGIKLNIKPTISEKKRVHVSLNVEVSEVGSAETIGDPTAPSAKAYPLSKRSVSTELFLNDEQTLAIGGLIKQKKEEDIRKVAGLGDIPLIGALFRKKVTKFGGGQGERGDIELFITLTPKIVSKPEASIDIYSLPQKKLEIKGNYPEQLKNYIRDIQTRIVSAAYYPPDARELSWEGTVNLSLLILNDGELKEANISQSSGYKILDEAAVDAVIRQAPFPSFPSQVELQELNIEVPIAYRKGD